MTMATAVQAANTPADSAELTALRAEFVGLWQRCLEKLRQPAIEAICELVLAPGAGGIAKDADERDNLERDCNTDDADELHAAGDDLDEVEPERETPRRSRRGRRGGRRHGRRQSTGDLNE